MKYVLNNSFTDLEAEFPRIIPKVMEEFIQFIVVSSFLYGPIVSPQIHRLRAPLPSHFGLWKFLR